MDQNKSNILPLPKKQKKLRKLDESNRKRDGSVRKINDQVYVDFRYMGERVRESSGLAWNEKNVKDVRKQLDKIILEIQSGTFRFAAVFPESKKANHFSERERRHFKLKKRPDEVIFEPEARDWYRLHKAQDVKGRTMLGYKSQLDNYLIPILGSMAFAEFNEVVWRELVLEAREMELRGKPICNNTINKLFVPLKMICHDTAVKYGWGVTYNPFFSWKKLKESKREIGPFKLSEQKKFREALSEHWKPYFDFAFCCGARPGEQIAIIEEDIDWENKLLHIQRDITMGEDGKRCEGGTKNDYSNRMINLTDTMLDALKRQKEIHDRLGGKYFFCTETGGVIYYSNLRTDVWKPTLEKAKLKYRSMGQTRHTFATVALAFGENPTWIASVMGHCNAEMILKVYTRHVANMKGIVDGSSFTEAYRRIFCDENQNEE